MNVARRRTGGAGHSEPLELRGAIRRLRRELEAMARAENFSRLRLRYALRVEHPQPLSLYRRARVAVGLALRRLGIRRVKPSPWLAPLKQSDRRDDAQALVIWAIGADRDTLRDVCRRLAAMLPELPALAPVLITDVADFAFYSRLGWLVEYVPRLGSAGHDFALRKQRYLAWRYTGSPALPITVAIDDALSVPALQQALAAEYPSLGGGAACS